MTETKEMKPKTIELKDFKVNVKIKLSALWASIMFCYVYGDLFTFFLPGQIEDLAKNTTPGKLFLYAISITLPALMVFLSITLKPKINRIANIVIGILYTLFVILVLTLATSFENWLIFYFYLGIVEILLQLLVVKYAWKWPKE